MLISFKSYTVCLCKVTDGGYEWLREDIPPHPLSCPSGSRDGSRLVEGLRTWIILSTLILINPSCFEWLVGLRVYESDVGLCWLSHPLQGLVVRPPARRMPAVRHLRWIEMQAGFLHFGVNMIGDLWPDSVWRCLPSTPAPCWLRRW